MSVTVVGSLDEDVLVAVRRLLGRGETVIGHGAEVAPGRKRLRPEDVDVESVRRASVLLLQPWCPTSTSGYS